MQETEMTTEMTEGQDGIHHEFSPSKLEQYALCPGSWMMQKGLPETESDAAAEGTMLHNAVATGDMDGLDADQRIAVESCIQYREKVAAGMDMHFEKRLTLLDSDGRPLTFGTADFVAVGDDGKAILIDWKFGRGEVTMAEGNLQLAAYAAAIMQEYGSKVVEACIYQPRLNHISWYPFQRLDAIISNIRHVIARCTGEALVLRPGERQCQYCKAVHSCPAFQMKWRCVQSVAEMENGVSLDDDETVLRLYKEARLVEKAVKAIDEAMQRRMDAGGGRLGEFSYKMVDGTRKVDDICKLQELVKDYMTPDEIAAISSVSLGKLDSILAERIRLHEEGVKSLKEAKARGQALYDSIVTRNAATRRIVAVSADSRDASEKE